MTSPIDSIWQTLASHSFRVSTDTREDVSGTIFFGIKGDNFDGNSYIKEALERGAVGAVTSDTSLTDTAHVFVVPDTLETLQALAKRYRENFDIPIIAIGGSNGKTTSKELTRYVMATHHKVHATEGSLNNHLGTPLSILSMRPETEVGIFEIGANHPGEHLPLLDILDPTHVVVTNNGLDHLEGFGSPLGAREANKELYDWALTHKRIAFVNQEDEDLMSDSEGLSRILYPTLELKVTSDAPLVLEYEGAEYKTQLFGQYNLQNIQLALAIGLTMQVSTEDGLRAITQFEPRGKRSEIREQNGQKFIVDCYNANPTSMQLALESFLSSTTAPRGVMLGDMLEMGSYAESEHKKILELLKDAELDQIILIGPLFTQAEGQVNLGERARCFPNSQEAGAWFRTQSFPHYTFLLKGSRGIQVEQVIEN